MYQLPKHAMFEQSQIIKKLAKFRAICACKQCQQHYECNIYDAAKSNVGHLCKACRNQITSLKKPTQEDLLRVYLYDEITGLLTYAQDSISGKTGEVVGYFHNQGYLSTSIGKNEYLVHRVIWFMKTGVWPDQIDHQDHDRRNNKWNNLRAVGSRENQLNLGKRKNSSPYGMGVRKLPSGKFCAFIMVKRIQICLGSYITLEEATKARKNAEVVHGFHINHGS